MQPSGRTQFFNSSLGIALSSRTPHVKFYKSKKKYSIIAIAAPSGPELDKKNKLQIEIFQQVIEYVKGPHPLSKKISAATKESNWNCVLEEVPQDPFDSHLKMGKWQVPAEIITVIFAKRIPDNLKEHSIPEESYRSLFIEKVQEHIGTYLVLKPLKPELRLLLPPKESDAHPSKPKGARFKNSLTSSSSPRSKSPRPRHYEASPKGVKRPEPLKLLTQQELRDCFYYWIERSWNIPYENSICPMQPGTLDKLKKYRLLEKPLAHYLTETQAETLICSSMNPHMLAQDIERALEHFSGFNQTSSIRIDKQKITITKPESPEEKKQWLFQAETRFLELLKIAIDAIGEGKQWCFSSAVKAWQGVYLDKNVKDGVLLKAFEELLVDLEAVNGQKEDEEAFRIGMIGCWNQIGREKMDKIFKSGSDAHAIFDVGTEELNKIIQIIKDYSGKKTLFFCQLKAVVNKDDLLTQLTQIEELRKKTLENWMDALRRLIKKLEGYKETAPDKFFINCELLLDAIKEKESARQFILKSCLKNYMRQFELNLDPELAVNVVALPDLCAQLTNIFTREEFIDSFLIQQWKNCMQCVVLDKSALGIIVDSFLEQLDDRESCRAIVLKKWKNSWIEQSLQIITEQDDHHEAFVAAVENFFEKLDQKKTIELSLYQFLRIFSQKPYVESMKNVMEALKQIPFIKHYDRHDRMMEFRFLKEGKIEFHGNFTISLNPEKTTLHPKGFDCPYFEIEIINVMKTSLAALHEWKSEIRIFIRSVKPESKKLERYIIAPLRALGFTFDVMHMK